MNKQRNGWMAGGLRLVQGLFLALLCASCGGGAAPPPGDPGPGAATAPAITAAPAAQNVASGGTATFSVAASGTAPLRYQWQRDGADIPGATLSSYTVAAVKADSNSSWRVIVSNAAGSVTSAAATLAVSGPGISLLAGTLGGHGSVDGMGVAARFYEPASVATDSAGNVYVADTKNNTIRRISPAGLVTTVAGQALQVGIVDGVGAQARFGWPGAVVMGRDGMLYVVDGGGQVRTITAAGVVTTLAPGTRVPRAVDSAGNLFFIAKNAIHKLSPAGVVSTFAGRDPFKPSYGPVAPGEGAGYADGSGTAAAFAGPVDLMIDGADNIIVVDGANKVLRKITPAALVTTIAGTPGVAGSADGAAASATFQQLGSMAIDAAGNIYVVDHKTIRRLSTAGIVTTLAGVPGETGTADGTGAQARFNTPGGIAVDAAGSVYVADTVSDTIRKVTAAGVTTTLAGAPKLAGGADGVGAAARFNVPAGIATDKAGNVYVADKYGQVIRKISPSGVTTTLAGTSGEPGTADGAGAAARFAYPEAVAADEQGNVYVADSGNATIRKITPAGVVSTLAGSAGQQGTVDATGAAARFHKPTSLALGAAGNLYVGDVSLGGIAAVNSIRKISPAGVVTTFAGGAGVALLDHPHGVALDAAGNVYVADRNNNVIRRISPAGVATTIAGSVGEPGSADGAGTVARFNQPTDIVIDRAGRLYVADSGNQTIRRIGPDGTVSTVAGKLGSYGNAIGALPGSLSGSEFGPLRLAIDASDVLYVTSSHAVLKIEL